MSEPIDVLLHKCADVIVDAQRREVPIERWTARAQEVLGEIYAMLEERECLTTS